MHIVVFTGGDFPAPESEKTYFSAKQEDGNAENRDSVSFFPDYVIVADSGLFACELYKSYYGHSFYPSRILGDMDSIKDISMLEKYPQKVIKTFIEDKDFSDTELALEEAYFVLSQKSVHKKSGANSEISANGTADCITLVGAGGGSRIDHLLGVFDLFASKLRPDVWLAGSQSLFYAPQHTRFSISGLKIDDMISIARTTKSRTDGSIASKGLKWEYGCFRREGMPSLSNRISPDYFNKNSPVEITIESGEFVLIVPSSASIKKSSNEAYI
jgi:thiamine pyrophosphokinase